jgi:hypothetical protein
MKLKCILNFQVRYNNGRAIAQAVSRWLPTAVAQVRILSGHVGFVADKVAMEHVFSEYFSFPSQGHAVAQAVSCWLPTTVGRVRIRASMWGLWWTKWHWGRFSPSTLVSPANHHSTNFSMLIVTRGRYNRPIGG